MVESLVSNQIVVGSSPTFRSLNGKKGRLDTVTLVVVIIISFLYMLGAYFFLIKKNYLETDSILLRIFFFVLSLFMVPGLLAERVEDWFRAVRSRRSR